jgi:1-acyl-sn-glycerol-3-phosphate acyltransferase
MTRTILTKLFRLLLRIYFRRIESTGVDAVPLDTPVIFASNHPNGLIDPLVLVCQVPRDASFLGKAPLFHYPVVGFFVRAFDSIPVYRKHDNTRGTNAETFARAREVLLRGGSIAIFPEGTTHSDSKLRELKTGAARIALGATLERITIVPVGIYYTDKQKFRSSVLIAYGEPIEVVPQAVGADGEPAHDAVDALTQKIDDGLDRVVLQADSDAALELIARAEDILTAEDEQRPENEYQLRRYFVRGYHFLRERDPQRLARIDSQLRQLEAELSRAGLEVHELKPVIRPGVVLRLLFSLPLAIVGALIHAPAYLLVDAIAKRAAHGEEEMTATMKVLASLVFYPLTWLACGLVADQVAGWPTAILVAIVGPFLFVLTVRVLETADDLIGGARAIFYRAFRTRGHQRLVTQRESLREEMLAVGREMQSSRKAQH